MGINYANEPYEFICRIAAFAHGRRTCLLEFAIVLKLKNNKKTFQRGNATAVNESTLRMWLDQPKKLIPIWLFPFFIFQDNVTAIRCN